MSLLSFIFLNVKPPSSLLYKAFFFASISAYTISGLFLAIAKPILPRFPFGKPFLSVRSSQVSPPL